MKSKQEKKGAVEPVAKKQQSTHSPLGIIVFLLLAAKLTVFPDMPWWVVALPLLPLVLFFSVAAITLIPFLGAVVVAVVAGIVLAVTHVWEWVERVWHDVGWVKRRRDRKREEAIAAFRAKRDQKR